jgi:hypothetical protein
MVCDHALAKHGIVGFLGFLGFLESEECRELVVGLVKSL